MKRKMRLVLDVEVADLPADERASCAELEGCKPSDLPGLKEVSALDLGDLIAGTLDEDNREIFAGSMIYAAFTKAEVVSATFDK